MAYTPEKPPVNSGERSAVEAKGFGGDHDIFFAAVEMTRMPMIVTDPNRSDNPIAFANAAFIQMTGYSREEIVGQNCRFLQGPGSDPQVVAQIRAAIEARTDISVEILNYRKDGSAFWNALFISPVRNDAGQVDYYFASQLDVTDRVEAQRFVEKQKALVDREVALRTADLEEALASKTLLLHEVDHRVKNNLTMIGSLLRLQARSLPDPSLGQTLNSMLERVDALATVHRRLYQSNDITTFDAGAFVETLAADVIGSSGRANIAVEVDVEPIMIPSAHASAVGLVVNELLTNAVKHGFPDGREGTLKVTATQSQRRGRIVIQDDGPGIVATANNGLGKTLISRLVRQIDGEARWLPANPGTRVVLEFPVSG